jgi:sodium-dependent dicarboxylate transporter 2/3/5
MKTAKLLAGPLAGIVLFFVLRQWVAMEVPAAAVAMLSIWMAIWWMTEAVPLELTALLPMLVLPLIGRFVSLFAHQIRACLGLP